MVKPTFQHSTIRIKVHFEFPVQIAILIFGSGGVQSYENFGEKELSIKKGLNHHYV